MKSKVSEASGLALDWLVNQIEECCDDPLPPRFSTEWSQGGPIIDREGISVVKEAEYDWWQAAVKAQLGSMFGTGLCGSHRQEGPTALIAAMRCFVASKLGDEVEVPDELLESEQ